MSTRSALSAVLLSLVLVVSACSKDEMATGAIDDLTKLTDDIVTTIKEADDKKAAVAEAQKKLDAAKGELGPKMKEVMELRGFQVGDEAKNKVAAGLVDNTANGDPRDGPDDRVDGRPRAHGCDREARQRSPRAR